MTIPEFYPSIDDYIDNIVYDQDICIDDIEDIAYKICGFVNVPIEISKTVITKYFKELRKSLLKGEKVYIPNIGYFSVQYRKNILCKFDHDYEFIKKMNGI